MQNLRFGWIVLAVCLAGCTSVPRGPVFSLVECPPDRAVVYVYRLYTPPYGLTPDIQVMGITVAPLPMDSYTVLKLKPGTYRIRTEWGSFNNFALSRTAVLPVEAGVSYVVNFDGKPGIIGTTVTYGAQVYFGELATIPPGLEICTYVAPKDPMPDPQ